MIDNLNNENAPNFISSNSAQTEPSWPETYLGLIGFLQSSFDDGKASQSDLEFFLSYLSQISNGSPETMQALEQLETDLKNGASGNVIDADFSRLEQSPPTITPSEGVQDTQLLLAMFLQKLANPSNPKLSVFLLGAFNGFLNAMLNNAYGANIPQNINNDDENLVGLLSEYNSENPPSQNLLSQMYSSILTLYNDLDPQSSSASSGTHG